MLKAIDDWLIDSVFQRLADWIADRYQKTVFMTARICVYLVLLNLIPRNLAEYGGKADILDFGFSALWPLVLLVYIRIEEQRFEHSGYGTMNSMRENLRIFRYLYIIVIPFTIVLNVTRLIDGSRPFLLSLLFLTGSLLITAATFFGSCSPKPPKPKEEKEEVPADAVLET